MSLLILGLIWAGLGLLVGLLALAAGLKPASWGAYARWGLLLLGLLAALLGGGLGFWLLGRLFSAATALWVAVLATCLPRLIERVRERLAGPRLAP